MLAGWLAGLGLSSSDPSSSETQQSPASRRIGCRVRIVSCRAVSFDPAESVPSVESVVVELPSCRMPVVSCRVLQ